LATPDVVDAGFAFVLTALAVVGFSSSFGGNEAATVGIPAALVGTLTGLLVSKLRTHLLVGALLGVTGFVLFAGAVAFRDEALAGFLPSAQVVEDLVEGSVRGWVGLLTTSPPAGQAGSLLAVPYVAGYFGAFLAITAAIGFPRWAVCMVPPVVVLGVAVLFGVDEPASLVLQGAVFGAVAVAWLSVRARRVDPALLAGGARRAVGGLAMLGVAGVAAFAVGPILPGADANDRFILRDHVDPPFQPDQYPSPLARFREWHGPQVVEGAEGVAVPVIDPDEVLFTVEGLPEGQVVRFAVMDAYDDIVWRASAPGTEVGGTYARVGDTIAGADEGEEATVRFEMGVLADPDSVWIPTFGSPTAIAFEGPNAHDLEESYRFNRDTETAASSIALREGDVWTVTSTYSGDEPSVDELDQLEEMPNLPFDAPTASDAVTARLGEVVDGLDAGATPHQIARRVAEHLYTTGYYSNGEFDRLASAPGHGAWRLEPFLIDQLPVGNGEQYAAGAAYALRAFGVPARVVLEFHIDPPEDGGVVEVVGEDAHASVEIALAGVGWVAIPEVTPPTDQQPTPLPEPTETFDPDPQVQPLPPTTLPLPESDFEDLDQRAGVDTDAESAAAAGGILGTLLKLVAIVAIPVVVLAGPAAVVVGMKRRRRNRRRSTGAPAARIANGWIEVTDLARDVGAPVPPKATRRELATLFGLPAAATLASAADGHVFGAPDPTDADAEATWQEVDALRAEMLAPLGRFDRLRAAVSLTSLRKER
jgi:hypothetical protein